jgi:hypothetical protein
MKEAINNRLLESALTYLQKFQFSVIPVRPDKKPHVKWEPYQKERASADQVRTWWAKNPKANVGLITGELSRIVVIDVDDPDAGMQALSECLTTAKTPTARTPRGGLHLYFKAPEKCPSNATGCPKGVDFRGEGGYIIAPPSVNGVGKGYEWLPSLSLDEIEPPPLPVAYIKNLNFLKQYVLGRVEQEKDEHTKAHEGTRKHILFEYGTRDEDLFHTANCLVKGGMDVEAIQQVLTIVMDSWGEGFDKKWRDEKIESALKRIARRERNIAQEVREWVESTQGHFESTQLHREAHISTKEDMHAVNVALQRLAKEGIIERFGEKRGAYRRVESDLEEIELDGTEDKPFDIELGLGLDEITFLYMRNIAVVSGSYESGKTAFLLNLAYANREKQKVRYFSSEMGRPELKARLRLFGYPMHEWKKVRFIDRSSNFSDAIDPAGLNIIDFLELTQEVYLVAEHIKKIYDKLTTGVCFVAIQKKRGADLGRGAEFSAEKARLYLSFDPGRIKIIKAKAWKNPAVNPRGMELSFKLVNGCKFMNNGDWSRPDGAETPSLYHQTPGQYKASRKMGKEDLTKEFSSMFKEGF